MSSINKSSSSFNNLDNLSIRIRSSTYRQPKPNNNNNNNQQQQNNNNSRNNNNNNNNKNQKQSQQRGVMITSPTDQNNDGGGGRDEDDNNNNNNLISIEPEVLSIHPPGDDAKIRRKDFILKSHIEYEISNVPKVSESGVNPTKLYDLRVAGMNHVEGGWPKDCDVSDPEHRIRHLRRTRKEANFLATVRDLATKTFPVLRSNNALDIYHSMFRDIIEGNLGEGIHSNPIRINSNGNNTNNNNTNKNDENNKAGDIDDIMSGDQDLMMNKSEDHHDGDENSDEDDDDGNDDNNNNHNNLDLNDHHHQKKKSGSGKRNQRRERELAAKRAQQHVEDLQVACLAGRTVGINATGVFRDAPRAFPVDLLGSDVKHLVKSEQKKFQEQKNIQQTEEAIQLATKAMMRQATNDNDDNDDHNRDRYDNDDDNNNSKNDDDDDHLGSTQKMTDSLSPQQQKLQQMLLNQSKSLNATSSTSTKKVVLGPTSSYTEPKVVSSLSWVSNLEIPVSSGGGNNNFSSSTNQQSSSSQQQQQQFSPSPSSGLGAGGGGGGASSSSASSTTLAIALASVQNTPHLALLGSTAKSELIRSSSLFMNQFGNNNNTKNNNNNTQDIHVSSPSSSQHQSRKFSSRFSSNNSNSSSNNVTMSGVDIFPTSLIYDANSPQAPLMRLKTASDLIQLEFSPRDAPLLASGSSDGTISLFDLRRGATRCIVVSDMCNSQATVLTAASSSSSPGNNSRNQNNNNNDNHASFRRNPLNPVCALRWVPSGTGARCTEFVTADLSPFVRIWDTRFVSRGCLDTFNLGSGSVMAAVQDLEDRLSIMEENANNNGGMMASVDDDERSGLFSGMFGGGGGGGSGFSSKKGRKGHHQNQHDDSNGTSIQQQEKEFAMQQRFLRNPLKAVSIDVQTVSGRVYIGTTDGKVFAFNRKGRTDSDRLCAVFQVVPREQTKYFTSTALSLFASTSASSSDGLADHLFGNNSNKNNNNKENYFSLDVYVHVAAHPTLPKCFAAATEWGVSVFADDLPKPIAQLPPSPHGVPTSIRWVPHCAALLCISRLSGTVELWDLCVMLTSPVLLNHQEFSGGTGVGDDMNEGSSGSSSSASNNNHLILGGGSQPKATATIMEYSGPSGFFSASSSSSSSSNHNHHYQLPKVVSEYSGGINFNSNNNNNTRNDGGTGSSSSNSNSSNDKNSKKGPPISSIRFSPDGTSLVAGLLDGSSTLLDVTVQDDQNLVNAAEEAQLNPKLNPNASASSTISHQSAVGNTTGAVAGVPQILGARALELACFSRIVEKRGVHRAKRLLQLQQQNAPDVTTASTLHYANHSQDSSSSSSLSMMKMKQKKSEEEQENEENNGPDDNKTSTTGDEKLKDEAKEQQEKMLLHQKMMMMRNNAASSSSGPSMTHDRLTLEMAKLSQNYQNQMVSLTDHSATAIVNQHNHPAPSGAPPPFKSKSVRMNRVMDRVGNLLYNPLTNINNNNNNNKNVNNRNADDDDIDDEDEDEHEQGGLSLLSTTAGTTTTVSSIPQQHDKNKKTKKKDKQQLVPLSAPLAEDDSAVSQLARAIETGVAVPPSKSRTARRWSTIRRHLTPKVKSQDELELDKYRQPNNSGSASSSSYYSPPAPLLNSHQHQNNRTSSSTSSHGGSKVSFGGMYQAPSGVFVPAEEQLAKLSIVSGDIGSGGNQRMDENSNNNDSSNTRTNAGERRASSPTNQRRLRATAFIDHGDNDE